MSRLLIAGFMLTCTCCGDDEPTIPVCKSLSALRLQETEISRLYPDLALEPTLIDFDSVSPGSTATATVTVRNSGDVSTLVRLEGEWQTQQGRLVAGFDPADVPVGVDFRGEKLLVPNEERPLHLTYAPPEPGRLSATFTIVTETDCGSAQVTLTGISP